MELSSPYFYNGGVYGWSCIKRVNPYAKRNKLKCVEVVVDKVTIDDGRTRGNAYVRINGVKQIVNAYANGDIGNFKLYDGKWWAFI